MPKIFPINISDKLKKYYFFVILAAVLVLIIYFLFLRFYQPPTTQKPSLGSPPIGQLILEPGETGEIQGQEASEVLSVPNLPSIISNTSGIIKETKEDRLIVQGSGSNFADQESRVLTVVFTNSTITFNQDRKNRYQGADGLELLKTGMKVYIEGAENIRGKTNFKAKNTGFGN